MATAGKVGAVYAPTTTNDNIDTTNTTDTFSGDGTTTTFQLTNEYIFVDSETVTVDNEDIGYTLNYITGELVFDTAPASGTNNITVNYDYTTIEQVAGFFDWTFDEDAGLEESPEFQDEHMSHVSTIATWSGNASKYWSVDDRFENWVGELVVMAFYIDDSAGTSIRFEGWGIIGNKDTDCPHDTLVEQTIDFEGQDFLEFRQ